MAESIGEEMYSIAESDAGIVVFEIEAEEPLGAARRFAAYKRWGDDAWEFQTHAPEDYHYVVGVVGRNEIEGYIIIPDRL